MIGPQPPEIIRHGGAVPCRGYSIGGVLDLETLTVKGGEYTGASIAQQACTPEALDHVFSEWQRLASDRPTLMIGATIEQAKLTLERFQSAGISTEMIVGSTSQGDRRAILDRVKSGETQVITSVGCLTKGFSLKPLSCILFVRATKSKALFHQCCGRACRPYSGKEDYFLLDFGQNLKRHGNPMADQNYDISEKPQWDVPMLKTCPECAAEISSFAAICPECGFVFSEPGPESEEEQEELILNQLTEFIDKFTKRKIKKLRRWRKQAWLAGTNPDEPINRFVAEYGHVPPDEWLLFAALGKRVGNRRKRAFVDYLEQHCKNTQWSNRWIRHHLNLEFGSDDLIQLGVFNTSADLLCVADNAAWAQVKAAYIAKLKALPQTAVDEIAQLSLALEDWREEMGRELNEDSSIYG